MRRNAAREKEEARMLSADVVIGNRIRPQTPPKLLQTVIQALPEESPAVRLLTQGSKRVKKNRPAGDNEKLSEHKVSNETIVMEQEKGTLSRSLLESIQKDIDDKQTMDCNLTDSEKALLAPKIVDEKKDANLYYDRDNGGYCKDGD